MNANKQKETTLDDLAIMVAEGFMGVNGRLDKVEGRLEKVEKDITEVKEEMGELKHKMEALDSTVRNYLELSEKRYFELKNRQDVIVSWVKTIADKTGVKIDFQELEKIV